MRTYEFPYILKAGDIVYCPSAEFITEHKVIRVEGNEVILDNNGKELPRSIHRVTPSLCMARLVSKHLAVDDEFIKLLRAKENQSSVMREMVLLEELMSRLAEIETCAGLREDKSAELQRHSNLPLREWSLSGKMVNHLEKSEAYLKELREQIENEHGEKQ